MSICNLFVRKSVTLLEEEYDFAMLKRKIETYLTKWKESEDRKPLVIKCIRRCIHLKSAAKQMILSLTAEYNQRPAYDKPFCVMDHFRDLTKMVHMRVNRIIV